MKLANKEIERVLNKQINMQDVPDLLCRIGFYLFLFFLVVVYSFYAPEGYIQLATNKYKFFRKLFLVTAGIMIPLATLRYMLSLSSGSANNHVKKKKVLFSITDLFVLLFLGANVISFALTEYKTEARWGTNGWNMGLAMMLAFIGIYFMASRLYDRKIDLLPLFMCVTAVVFFWGLLNRFSIYPVDMQYLDPAFISSIGNINWFCGYWSVFFAIGTVLYVVEERHSLRVFAMLHSMTALAVGIMQGSDSGFISIGVVFFFLFWLSFQKTIYMKRWLELCIFICASCQVMRMVAALGPKQSELQAALEAGVEYTGWKGLNMVSTAMALMLGNLTLVALVIFLLLWFWITKADKKYIAHYGTGKGRVQSELIWKFSWIKYAAAGLVGTAATVFVALIIANTKAPGSIGFLSNYGVFQFNDSWGSNRGATWTDGMLIYRTFVWWRRLFGVGPDCFSIYAYSIPELAELFQEQWNGARLTNAHNECITFLVDTGIFGFLSFIGIFWSSVRRLCQKAKEDPTCYVFAAAALSYFFHNQVSFSQVTNIPFIFLMLGLGENLMRKIDGK